MGARHSKKKKRSAESDGASASVAPEQEKSAQRVMSISPADIDPSAEPMTIDHDDILLTPRVLDQTADGDDRQQYVRSACGSRSSAPVGS